MKNHPQCHLKGDSGQSHPWIYGNPNLLITATLPAGRQGSGPSPTKNRGAFCVELIKDPAWPADNGSGCCYVCSASGALAWSNTGSRMSYKVCTRCQFVVPQKSKLCTTCGCNKFVALYDGRPLEQRAVPDVVAPPARRQLIAAVKETNPPQSFLDATAEAVTLTQMQDATAARDSALRSKFQEMEATRSSNSLFSWNSRR